MISLVSLSLCKPCWNKTMRNKRTLKKVKKSEHIQEDETSALLIGSLTEVSDKPAVGVHTAALEDDSKMGIPSSEFNEENLVDVQHPSPGLVWDEAESPSNAEEERAVSSLASNSYPLRSGCDAAPVTLDHHIFDWKND